MEASFKEILEHVDKSSKKFPDIFKGNYSCENIKQGIQKAQSELIPVSRLFANVYDQILNLSKENFSWSYVQQLYRQSQAIQAPNSFTTETVKMMKAGNLFKIAENTYGFKKAVETGEIPVKLLPTKQDLDFLWEICSEVPKNIGLNWKRKSR